MIIIVEKTTNEIVYLLTEPYSISQDYLEVGSPARFIDQSVNSDDFIEIEVDREPQDFMGRKFLWIENDYEINPEYVEPIPSLTGQIDTGAIMLTVFADPPIGLGKTKSRLMVQNYPDAQIALDRQNWPALFSALDDMIEDDFLDQEELNLIVKILNSRGVEKPLD